MAPREQRREEVIAAACSGIVCKKSSDQFQDRFFWNGKRLDRQAERLTRPKRANNPSVLS
jgi:hypothetical protein